MDYIQRRLLKLGILACIMIIGKVIQTIITSNKEARDERKAKEAEAQGRIIRRTLEPAPKQLGALYGLSAVMLIFFAAIAILYFTTGYDPQDPETGRILLYLGLIFALVIGIITLCVFITKYKRVYYIFDENGIEFHDKNGVYRRNWDYFKELKKDKEAFVLTDHADRVVLTVDESWIGFKEFLNVTNKMLKSSAPA